MRLLLNGVRTRGSGVNFFDVGGAHRPDSCVPSALPGKIFTPGENKLCVTRRAQVDRGTSEMS